MAPTTALKALNFPQMVSLFKAAGYTEFQLVPGHAISSWCALLPGETTPTFDPHRDNYYGWFSSQEETINTVVDETIVPMVMDALGIPEAMWLKANINQKTQYVEHAAHIGVFAEEGRSVLLLN